MKTGDWILVGVGAAQAVALAVAAVFSWLAYVTARREREAARLEPVVRELLVLAELLEAYRADERPEALPELLGQQARLGVALDSLPIKALPQARLLARLPHEDLVYTGQINAARTELGEAMRALSPAFRQL